MARRCLFVPNRLFCTALASALLFLHKYFHFSGENMKISPENCLYNLKISVYNLLMINGSV